MDHEKFGRSLAQLPGFIDKAYILSEEEKYFDFDSYFKVFLYNIQSIYKTWFPNSKTYKDTDVISHIFRSNIKKRDEKIWVKYSLFCIINSSQRVYKNIQKAKAEGNQKLFLSEMDFLKELSIETIIFMETAFLIIDKKDVEMGYGKRFFITPVETFHASIEILKKHSLGNTIGNFAYRPSSIFLIRQSIELWLQSIFGINHATDNKGNLIKLQPEKLFGLLDQKNELVELPIPKATIQKIHTWTQPYVHAGWMVYLWEIEHVQYVLEPIFRHSNVKIKRKHFETIDTQLRVIFDNPQLNLHQNKNHHDSEIMD